MEILFVGSSGVSGFSICRNSFGQRGARFERSLTSSNSAIYRAALVCIVRELVQPA